jgi:hypothetical protein
MWPTSSKTAARRRSATRLRISADIKEDIALAGGVDKAGVPID